MFDLLRNSFLIPYRFDADGKQNPVIMTDENGQLLPVYKGTVHEKEYWHFHEVYKDLGNQKNIYFAQAYRYSHEYQSDHMDVKQKILEKNTGVRTSMNRLSKELGVTGTVDVGLMSIEFNCFDGKECVSQSLSIANTGVNTSKLYRMELLRKFGGEYGAATGRPRRVGPFDAVASRYGLKCQNADKIALTKLDVLSMMEEIPVIVGYKKGNQEVTDFDPVEDLEEYAPIVRMLPGWQTDISGCKTYDELPDAAKAYVETLEDLLQHEIQFISVGAERSQYLTKAC